MFRSKDWWVDLHIYIYIYMMHILYVSICIHGEKNIDTLIDRCILMDILIGGLRWVG